MNGTSPIAAWRAAFFVANGCFVVPSKESALIPAVDRWLRQGRVFAVEHEGERRVPLFQFRGGRPIPILAEVLALLPSRSGWEAAYFLTSPNSSLGSRSPLDIIEDAPARVLSLAQAFVAPAAAF